MWNRSAHQAVLHLPQLLYFSLFFAALTFSFTAAFLADFLTAARSHVWRLAGSLALLAAVVHWNTLAHPYLLADNRHLTFYIWRRFLARHWAAKFLPVPAYMFGLYALARLLNRDGVSCYDCFFGLKLNFVILLSLHVEGTVPVTYLP